MPPASNIAFTLGDITFYNFDVPEEVPDFGGQQKLVVHDFPGPPGGSGVRTIQSFGDFPHEQISWKAHLFNDPDAGNTIATRVSSLDAMRRAGQLVTLSVGIFQYQVRIWKITYGMKLEVWVPYSIVLIPVYDLQQNAPPFAPNVALNSVGLNNAPSFAPFTSPNSLPNIINNSIPQTAPPLPTSNDQISGPPNAIPPSNAPLIGGIQQSDAASPANIPAVKASNAQLGAQLNYSGAFPTFPKDALSSLTAFQQGLIQALQGASPDGTNLVTPQLNELYQAAIAPLPALANGIDPATASFATVANAIMGNIGTSMAVTIPQQTEIPVVNPDLRRLATFYYGNQAAWQTLASANGVSTPKPIGNFPRFKIPAAA